MAGAATERDRKPRAKLGGADNFGLVEKALRQGGLATVCREARCPNRAECYGKGTATIMLMGSICTRGCAFCAVESAPAPPQPPDDEPAKIARAISELGLSYAVLTSPSRDDLPLGGAPFFAETIRELRRAAPATRVEALIPDYTGEPLKKVLEAAPDVLAHNLETVARLTPLARHPRFGYLRSLQVLREAADGGALTKSSLMLGLGERWDEVLETFGDLRRSGVSILSLGQYLCPGPGKIAVDRYLPDEEFVRAAAEARGLGFKAVAAGPLVRTSYRALETFMEAGGRVQGG